MPNWTVADIPSQIGKMAIITGATGGLGYETTLELARAGAEVVLVGRSDEKGRGALRRILAQVPHAPLRFENVDLASLASVRSFASRILAEGRPIDLLVNNAGVMLPPKRRTTSDGFELQFGTNYLSHFALTAQLLPLLRRGQPTAPAEPGLSQTGMPRPTAENQNRTAEPAGGSQAVRPQARVVNVSSLAHRQGGIRFDDLQFARRYIPWAAYAQSKLAMLMFALELQRRSDADGWGLMSNAAHPGVARTDLVKNGPGERSLVARVSTLFGPLISQTAAAGALPILFAAASPDAKAAGYYGPDGFQELKGAVAPAHIAAKAKDPAAVRKLWQVSEQLTGATWPQF